jgi:glycosyltransferase involved in cell wall biosynthesis
MNYPKVSVLMAVYNRPELIKKAVESFLRQTYQNCELIICDDCSTDSTLEVIKQFAKENATIKWHQNKTNQGFITTINWLFSIADGEYVCICDSDDEMATNRIEHQLSVLNLFQADAVISGMAKIDKYGNLIPNKPLSNSPVQVTPDTKQVQYPSGSLFMHKRVIEKVKGYHSYFSDAFCGDIYLINTIATQFKLIYDPTPVYYYRLTEGSMTQTFNLYHLSKLELAKELIQQRKDTGTDLLEQNNFEALEEERLKIIKNKKWRAEQYRLYASRAIDEGKFKTARNMISLSLRSNPFSWLSYKTVFYLVRSSVKAKLNA